MATSATNSYHHGDLRSKLLATALSSDSLQSTSLRQLATGLGVTPAAVYRHFDSKQALLDELAAMGFDKLTVAFEGAFDLSQPPQDAHDARSRVQSLARAYLDFAHQEPALWRLMFASDTKAWRSAQRTMSRPSTYQYLQAMLFGLHRTGWTAHAPTDEDELMAWSLIHGMAVLRDGQVPMAQHSTAELAERVARWLCRPK